MDITENKRVVRPYSHTVEDSLRKTEGLRRENLWERTFPMSGRNGLVILPSPVFSTMLDRFDKITFLTGTSTRQKLKKFFTKTFSVETFCETFRF